MVRDAEWDDVERAKLLALADFEDSLCECGFPESVADEDPDLQVKYRVCPVCAGIARAQRIQAANDEAATGGANKTNPPQMPLPADGRYMGLEPKPTKRDGSAEDQDQHHED